MRLRAFQELNIDAVEVSIVKPKNEATKVKYALSDNDRAGHYVEQELTELLHAHKDEITLSDYKIDLGKAISTEKFLMIETEGLPAVDTTDESGSATEKEIECPECGHTFTK